MHPYKNHVKGSLPNSYVSWDTFFFQYLFLISILKCADFLTCARNCDTPGKPRPDDLKTVLSEYAWSGFCHLAKADHWQNKL